MNIPKLIYRTLLPTILLTICGCNVFSQNADSGEVSDLNDCPDKPKTVLDQKNVETINFSAKKITEKGSVSWNKSVGYSFVAQAKQELHYKTSEDICITLYTPENQIIQSGVLPVDGKYLIQISVPKGSTTFNLEMNLETVTAASISIPTIPPISINKPLATPDQERNINNNSLSTVKPVSKSISERPLADAFVRNHYQALSNRDYSSTYSNLSSQFIKNNLPNGYDGYQKWWNSVKSIEIGNVRVISQTNEKAIVNAQLWYTMNQGKRFKDSRNRIYLLWDKYRKKWLFNRKD